MKWCLRYFIGFMMLQSACLASDQSGYMGQSALSDISKGFNTFIDIRIAPDALRKKMFPMMTKGAIDVVSIIMTFESDAKLYATRAATANEYESGTMIFLAGALSAGVDILLSSGSQGISTLARIIDNAEKIFQVLGTDSASTAKKNHLKIAAGIVAYTLNGCVAIAAKSSGGIANLDPTLGHMFNKYIAKLQNMMGCSGNNSSYAAQISQYHDLLRPEGPVTVEGLKYYLNRRTVFDALQKSGDSLRLDFNNVRSQSQWNNFIKLAELFIEKPGELAVYEKLMKLVKWELNAQIIDELKLLRTHLSNEGPAAHISYAIDGVELLNKEEMQILQSLNAASIKAEYRDHPNANCSMPHQLISDTLANLLHAKQTDFEITFDDASHHSSVRDFIAKHHSYITQLFVNALYDKTAGAKLTVDNKTAVLYNIALPAADGNRRSRIRFDIGSIKKLPNAHVITKINNRAKNIDLFIRYNDNTVSVKDITTVINDIFDTIKGKDITLYFSCTNNAFGMPKNAKYTTTNHNTYRLEGSANDFYKFVPVK